MSKPKPYNSGQWTQARMNSFVKSALRGARWPVKYECIKSAYTGKSAPNPATGRLCKQYRCADCMRSFPQKHVRADHIKPVVDPVRGFVDWNTYVERLFVELDGFQCLCKECHDAKTARERKARK